MSYSWSQNSRVDGIEPGRYFFTITEYEAGDEKGPFVSRNGDFQIRLKFTEPGGRSTTKTFTLGEKSAFRLAQVLGCFDPPMNLAAMEAQGIEPAHFANPEFGRAQLIGRSLWGEVWAEHYTDQQGQTKTRMEMSPLKPQASGVGPAQPPASVPSSQAPARLSSPPAPAAPRPAATSVPAAPAAPVAAAPALPAAPSLAPAPAPAMPAPSTAPPAAATELTRDAAWSQAWQRWGAKGDKLTEAWREACRTKNKPDHLLTGADWIDVLRAVDTALDEVPF